MSDDVDTGLSSDAEDRAVAILLLVLDFPHWVHRRVESIEILDDTTLRRRVSLDLEPPNEIDDIAVADTLSALPITFLRKEVLRNFDLDDAEDHPVPVLTKSQNARLAGDTLAVMAATILDRDIPGSIEGRLRVLAEADLGDAVKEFTSWHRFTRDHNRADWEAWRDLIEHKGFRDYAAHLSRHFILFAHTAILPGQRRLMKLAYDETFEAVGPRGKRLGTRRKTLERLGWIAKEIRIAAPAVNLASSFHVELGAPPEMQIDRAALDVRRGERVESRDIDGRLVAHVHLYVSQVPPARAGTVRVLIRSQRRGFLTVALIVAGMMAALLGAGLAWLDPITEAQSSQTAAALLLLGPTLLAAGLLRPGEHELVSHVLAGPRLFLWAEIVAGVVAVALLAGMAEGARQAVWIGALALGCVAAVGLLVSYLLPRPTSSPDYESLPVTEE